MIGLNLGILWFRKKITDTLVKPEYDGCWFFKRPE